MNKSQDAINLVRKYKLYDSKICLECFERKLKRDNKLWKIEWLAKDHYENRDVFELIKFHEILLQMFEKTSKKLSLNLK